MRGPKPPEVVLSAAECRDLDGLARAHRTPQQVALRARIVLAAAQGLNNTQIARRLGVDADTVRLWRMRWLGLQAARLEDLSVAERLSDAPKPGAPARITAEQVLPGRRLGL
jgi:putative transposase